HFTLFKILSAFPMLLIILLLGSTAVAAQGLMITGKIISSEDGLEIPGANVLLKGTAVGTSTDISGRYSIQVPSTSSVLVFSFIGYETREVEIGARSVINVTLSPEAEQL